MGLKTFVGFMAACVLLAANSAHATIHITEWAYQGADGEYFELTNLGNSPVDMTGWSMSDDNATPGWFDLSPFGVVAPKESVIVTENAEALFRTAWNLAAGVKVIGLLGTSGGSNLGRGDEINIYDALDALADRLDYGDQDFPGSPRTQNRSGNPLTAAALGADDPTMWVLSSVSDRYGSYASAGGDIGNPGVNVVPEPASIALILLGGIAALGIRRLR